MTLLLVQKAFYNIHTNKLTLQPASNFQLRGIFLWEMPRVSHTTENYYSENQPGIYINYTST